jgi:hypothetical protein
MTRAEPVIVSLPRRGSAPEEYEDAAAIGGALNQRLAIADGATESSFSGDWARLLVKGYVDHGDLTAAWALGRAVLEQEIRTRSAGMPWYALAKVEQGVHATFLGVTVDRQLTLSATAVGDACLFVVRGGKVVRRWPIEDAGDFTHQPDLVSNQQCPEPMRLEWECRPGDRVVLATDAVAALLMTADESLFDALTTQSRFAEVIEGARDRGLIRNDDSTAILVDLGGD